MSRPMPNRFVVFNLKIFQYLGSMPRYFFVLYIFLLLPTCWAIFVWNDFLYGINLLILLIGVCFGINFWQRISLALKFVVLTIAFSYLIEILSTYLAYFYKNNMVMTHIGLPFLFISTTAVFTGIFKNHIFKLWFLIPLLLLGFTFILLMSNYQGSKVFPTYGNLFFSFSTIVFSLFALKKIAFSNVKSQLTKNPFFWFILGSLFFYFLTFFIYGFWLKPNYHPNWLLLSMLISNIILNSCYLYSIWLSTKENPTNG